MRSEEEVRRLLKMLEEAKRACDEEYEAAIRERRPPDHEKCRVEVSGYTIFTDVDHDGLSEWIAALKWVLEGMKGEGRG